MDSKVNLDQMMTQDIIFQQRLTTGEAARELQIAPGTLQNYRALGTGPRYMKLGRNVYYLMSDLIEYMNTAPKFYKSTQEWKRDQKKMR